MATALAYSGRLGTRRQPSKLASLALSRLPGRFWLALIRADSEVRCLGPPARTRNRHGGLPGWLAT